MSGKIIELRRHRGVDRASLYRNQPVPRGPAAKARLDQQVARILSLLCELEALTLDNSDMPAALLERTRAIIDKTDSVLQAVLPSDGESADDPQPNVDNSLLERMYRELDLPA